MKQCLKCTKVLPDADIGDECNECVAAQVSQQQIISALDSALQKRDIGDLNQLVENFLRLQSADPTAIKIPKADASEQPQAVGNLLYNSLIRI